MSVRLLVVKCQGHYPLTDLKNIYTELLDYTNCFETVSVTSTDDLLEDLYEFYFVEFFTTVVTN
jgi:hypothetical protein